MDATTRASTLFIAAGVLFAGLYLLRDILAPFALAVFLWLVIDGFANAFRRRFEFLPRAATLFLAVMVVSSGVVAVVAVIADTASEFASSAPLYQQRVDQIIAQFHASLRFEGDPPTIGALFSQPSREFFTSLYQTLRSLTSSAVFVLVYVVFLFAAQAQFPSKMEELFPEHEGRERARDVIGGIRHSLEKYLWVQTFVSVITATLCYGTLVVLGVDNALFWAFLIFLFNYIPTIGSIVVTFLPALFSLVQFDTLWQPLAVFLGVGVWQFLIGNFVQPRMQGENLNLSVIVVLLGLAVWGAVWGLPGMFLSSPLTVMLMIVLAQFTSTRWIAILLSADGRPDGGRGKAALPDARGA